MYLFLLDFQVNLGFQGIQPDQVALALHGVLGFQGGQQDRVALDCCYCIRREFGWASCLFCSSDLQVEVWKGNVIGFWVPSIWRIPSIRKGKKNVTYCSQAAHKLVSQWNASCPETQHLPGKQNKLGKKKKKITWMDCIAFLSCCHWQ